MKISLWWDFEGRYILSNIKQGIKNIWYWFPIIWKDRNWDDHYIFEVLKHKLKRQSKYIGDREFHSRSKQDARDMMICVNLIEKIQDEFYAHEYFEYYKEKDWFEPCKDKEGYFTLESELVWENFDSYFKKYPLIYKQVIEKGGIFANDCKKHIAINIGYVNQTRAQNLLFRIMNDKIRGWWD